MTAAVIATGLGKRYRRHWGLRECTLEVPEGRVVALVGPNGAGKTTLLQMAAGLLRPTAGTIRVLAHTPDADVAMLPDVGFVAQDVPLYRSFTVADLLEFGRRMNVRWDGELAQGASGARGHRLPTAGRHSVRRTAGAGRADPGAGEASRACSCSTSLWPASTRWPAGSSSRP